MKSSILFAPLLVAHKNEEFGSGDDGLEVRLGSLIDSPLCPSEYNGQDDSGCYVQNDEWSVGADITCQMMNKSCLKVISTIILTTSL